MSSAADDQTAGDGARVEDAHFAITQFSFWINNADMKAGLLATATTLLTAAVVSQKAAIARSFCFASSAYAISVGFLIATAVLLVLTIAGLFSTLRPRRQVDGFSRYSWVSVAAADASDLRRNTPESGQRDEALQTSKVLAGIAKSKLNSLAFAALCWLLAGFSALIWYIFLPM